MHAAKGEPALSFLGVRGSIGLAPELTTATTTTKLILTTIVIPYAFHNVAQLFATIYSTVYFAFSNSV